MAAFGKRAVDQGDNLAGHGSVPEADAGYKHSSPERFFLGVIKLNTFGEQRFPLAPLAGRGTCLPLVGEHVEAAAEGEGATADEAYQAIPPRPRSGFASAHRGHDEVPATLSPPSGESA